MGAAGPVEALARWLSPSVSADAGLPGRVAADFRPV